jgi:hypothetical protein
MHCSVVLVLLHGLAGSITLVQFSVIICQLVVVCLIFLEDTLNTTGLLWLCVCTHAHCVCVCVRMCVHACVHAHVCVCARARWGFRDR